MSKRVYKFISARYGIQSLKDRRLKVSTLADLNDPFDLFNAIDTGNPQVASAITLLAAQMGPSIGLLCFSRNWDNLLLWSHYAAGHSGLCLGFDVFGDSADRVYMDVHYQPNLLKIREARDVNIDLAYRLLCTKHESWSYEQEVRFIVGINDSPDDAGLFWYGFGPELRLREVIVGAQCLSEDANAVCGIVKDYQDQIECTWAYMRSDAFLLLREKTAHTEAFAAQKERLLAPIRDGLYRYADSKDSRIKE